MNREMLININSIVLFAETEKLRYLVLKINYRKVLDMILLGDISAIKIGRQYRIDKCDLLEYLKNNKIQRMA